MDQAVTASRLRETCSRATARGCNDGGVVPIIVASALAPTVSVMFTTVNSMAKTASSALTLLSVACQGVPLGARHPWPNHPPATGHWQHAPRAGGDARSTREKFRTPSQAFDRWSA